MAKIKGKEKGSWGVRPLKMIENKDKAGHSYGFNSKIPMSLFALAKMATKTEACVRRIGSVEIDTPNDFLRAALSNGIDIASEHKSDGRDENVAKFLVLLSTVRRMIDSATAETMQGGE